MSFWSVTNDFWGRLPGINCLATKREVLIFIEIWLSSTMEALSSGYSLIRSARPTVRTFLDPSHYWQSWPDCASVTSYFCSGLLCSHWGSADLGTHLVPTRALVHSTRQQGCWVQAAGEAHSHWQVGPLCHGLHGKRHYFCLGFWLLQVRIDNPEMYWSQRPMGYIHLD